MSEFKDGDWIIITILGNEVLQYHEEHYKLLDKSFIDTFFRHATPEEIKAGHRL